MSHVDATRAVSERGQAPTLVEDIRWTLRRRGSFTEIMRKALLFCAERRSFSAVEDEIATYPEFKYVDYSQAAILDILIHAGALTRYSLDKEGKVLTEGFLGGLSEDVADELVRSFALETTEAGACAIAGMEPASRLAELYSCDGERAAVYCRIMEYCREPRTFEEVAALLATDAPLKSRNPYTDLPLYPSAFLGHLEAAGGLVWDEAWVLTAEGAEFLDAQAAATRAASDAEGGK